MTYYRQVVATVLILLGLYAGIGSITWYRFGYEIYPIFPWELFSRVPTTVSDYGLRITHLNGQPLDPPVYFEDAPDRFPEARSIIASGDTQSLGAAIERNDQPGITSLRQRIEARYLAAAPSVQYEVVKRQWLPLERYRQHTFVDEHVIAQFEARR